MCGARTYPRARVEALLAEAEAEYRLSKPWSAACYAATQDEVRQWRSAVHAAARAAPRGAAELPAARGAGVWGLPEGSSGGICDGCGRLAVELKRCSRCQAVSYCGCARAAAAPHAWGSRGPA
jgi:hypothetical protein